MARSRHREGTWFGVPLHGGLYAVGLVARSSRSGILLGYFFGPAIPSLPTLVDVMDLAPSDAVVVGRFGYLGLKLGQWPILGHLDHWDRSLWPTPPLVRYERLTGRTYRTIYDDKDPSKLVREELVAPGIQEQGPKDGLMGHIFVQEMLTRILSQPPAGEPGCFRT